MATACAVAKRQPGEPQPDDSSGGAAAALAMSAAVVWRRRHRPGGRCTADLERRRDAGAQGLRRVLGRGDRPGARGHGSARVDARRTPDAPLGTRAWAAHRPAARARPQRPHRRRRLRIAATPAPHPSASAGGAVRRQRLDGSLLADAPALRPCHRAPASPRRGVRLRHPAHARHRRAARQAPRPRGVGRVARRAGLVRRHAHRRGPSRSSTSSGGARLGGGPVVLLISDGWDRGDPALLARAGQAAAAELSSPDLAQPAHRHARLRAADARTAGGPALRGRLPARAHAGESRGAGGTLEHARDSEAEWTSPAPTRSTPRPIASGPC